MSEISWDTPIREADAWIAEHVMGWTNVHLDQKFGEVDQWRGYNPKSTYAWCVLPWYTRNIAAAWGIVEAFRRGAGGHAAACVEMHVWDHLGPDCYCSIYGPDLARVDTPAHTDMPLAISHAAYLALQGEGE